ncbi:MAG: DUF6491 family protein [Woeseiaceae bacterium]
MTHTSKFNLLLKQIVISFYLCSLVACAGTQTDEEGADSARSDCIYQPSIRGYSVLDESNLIVSASGRRQYHVVLRRRAFGLRSNWSIGFKSPTGRICSGFSEVVFDGHFDGESIRITSIRELSVEEEEDLLIRYGKKEPEYEHTPTPKDVKGADVEELDPAADENSSGD